MKFKKMFVTLLFILIVCILEYILFFNTSNTKEQIYSASSNEQNEKTQESEIKSSPYDLAFAVFSDIHDNDTSFQDAVDDIKATDIKLDALVLNGDTVDQGIDSQYETMTGVIEKNKKILPEIMIKNIGNHEFYNYENGNKTKEDVDEKIQKYLDFAQEDKVYHDKWINGYHFISLGSEDGNSPTCSSTSACLSDTQINWFKEKLAENYEKGKPIFVFLHQPLILNWGWGDIPGTNMSTTLRNILSQYPESIIFTSHTHKQMSSESVNTDNIFTSAQTGAISYSLFVNDDGTISRDYSYTTGLYVTVIGNNVTIHGRDIENSQWIFSRNIAFKQ